VSAAHVEAWTVGTDAVRRGTRGGFVPDGRLHAVGAAGLVEGRALCWICLGLTHHTESELPCDCCPAA